MVVGEDYVIQGAINIFSSEMDFSEFHFEVNLELLPKYNEDENQIALYGTLKTDRDGIIKEDSLNYKLLDFPAGVRKEIRETIKRKIKEYIRTNVDFTEISGMSRVIDYIITHNHHLTKFEYRVSAYPYTEERSITKQPSKKLRFGTPQERFSCNYVNISVYEDKVVLHCATEGSRKHEAKIDRYKEKSLEQSIMNALVAWSSYFD